MPVVVETDRFPTAERCALRLDGDCFDLGLTVVHVDTPVGAAVRAASLAPAARLHGLVAELLTAAWVHGVHPVLPNPLDLALDLRTTRRTRTLVPPPRERRFGPADVEELEGVRVTTRFRTAFDLVHRFPADPGAAAVAGALLSGWTREEARAAGLALPGSNGKHAAIDRVVRLLAA